MTAELDNLILNERTKSELEHYLASPTHALILSGTVGVGLGSIAKALSHAVAQGNVILIEPTIHNKQKTSVINIDDVRKIYGAQGHRHADKLVIIIDDIDMMTNDAPQAFLKLLEEPSDNIFYIMTTHELSSITETVRSRSQIVTVTPPSDQACQPILDSSPLKLTADKTRKITFMANGRPAELTRLISDESYYRASSELFEKAKTLLSAKPFDRLKVISGISNRTEGIELAKNLGRMLPMTAKDDASAKALGKKLDVISRVVDNLNRNGNLRVQLLFLVMNI